MVDRIFMNDDHLVISKAGHNASNPALSDANKVFDSDWGYSAALLWKLWWRLPANLYDVPGSTVYSIPFPEALSYRPAATVYVTRHGLTPGTYSTLTLPQSGRSWGPGTGYVNIFTDRIELGNAALRGSGYGMTPSTTDEWGVYALVFGL